MKLVVLILLAGVVISLMTGLFFLVRDRDQPDSPRLLTALKVRVVMSVILVLFLVIAYSIGWIQQ